jgi:hypothetical protein
MILGTGQLTSAITDAGAQGGSLTLAMNSGTAGSGGALLFAALNDNSTYVPQWAIKSLLVNGSSNGIGSLAFSTRASGTDTSLTERMRITSGGSVCVGSTAAGDAGAITVSVGLAGTTVGGLQLWSTTNGTHYLQFGDGTSGSDTYRGYVGYAHASDALLFATSTTERMRIDSSGNLLVGRTSTTGNARFAMTTSSTSNLDYGFFVANSAGTRLIGVDNNGGFSTGVAAGSPYNATTGSAANVFIDSDGVLLRSTSSLKYKTDVQDATHGLDEVMQLRPVTYKGKNDGELVFGGLIAEEVDAIGLKEFVQYAENGTPDALAYGNMVSLAFKAIQELKATVDAQAARIAALESK